MSGTMMRGAGESGGFSRSRGGRSGNLWYDYSGKPKLDGLDWNGWKNCGKESLGMYADPLFENPDVNDFRLKPESPAFALGFKPWDYSKAGRRSTLEKRRETDPAKPL